MKKDWLAILLMIVIVPLAGELKFYPFAGEFTTFRVSFGSPAFLFFLLWLRSTSFLTSGLLAGFSVLVFRMVLDMGISNIPWNTSFYLQIPAFCYYVTYAFIFYMAKVDNVYSQPLRIASWSIIAEITASIVELLLAPIYVGIIGVITFPIITRILLIAIIRSFFVLSFFFIMRLRQIEFVAEHQKEQNKHMLLLISSLYKELVQLTKSQQNAESITRDCYTLYKDLQSGQPFNKDELTQNILSIAGQVHEIKKDNQRIYASLTQLISEGKLNDYMNAAELAEIIVQSHQKYAQTLNKSIKFNLTVDTILPSLHVYTVLSIVNNLVSNAVESIKDSGFIKIGFKLIDDNIEFWVSDNGPGIPPKKRKLIFKPGYTTKFDISGNPSTGMGLSYIKDLVNNLNGSITVLDTSHTNETVFVIKLPLKAVTKEG